MSTNRNAREALPSARGYDYQKIKVLKLLLENLNDEDACAAIEYVDDVYLEKNDGQGKIEKEFRQVKDYEGEKDSISCNHKAIQGALANFLETWLQFRRSQKLKFFLCLTNKIAKERMTAFLTASKITLPAKPILELIKDKNYDEAIPFVQNVLTAVFSSEESRKPFLEDIKKMKAQDWNQFLSQVIVEDCSEVYEQLLIDVMGLLRKHEYVKPEFNVDPKSLMEKLVGYVTMQSGKPDGIARMIKTNDIRLKIIEEIKDLTKNIDPSGELSIEATDSRNLKEKISAVCDDYKQKNIKILERRSAMFMLEALKLSSDPAFRSMKIRIYDKCDEILSAFILKNGNRPMTSQEVDNLLNELKLEGAKHLKELSVDYTYPLNNLVSIEGLVLNLFDSCFLAFDEA